MIDFDHSKNVPNLDSPRAALPVLLAEAKLHSLLDVGCGTGTWLRAAIELGVPEVFGLDGAEIPQERLFVPPYCFQKQDLTRLWKLERCFDAVLCLEVAEHLEENDAPSLLDALVAHADLIMFSAACPGQPGHHHVHCRWPSYWQAMFNARGYVCSDDVRWRLWDDSRIEPWYRQNIFIARRDPMAAGKEPRIRAVVHPALYELVAERAEAEEFTNHVRQIQQGQMSLCWYATLPVRALLSKLRRCFS